jgi:2-oxoglutarate ferredoxin oxidoreductase subunit beta
MATQVESRKKRNAKVNEIGLEKTDYRGRETTLCQGCGHNSISSQIMAAAFELSIKPERMIKLSGIGCSSKSPAYFMSRSYGFNSLHGRMPSIATGAIVSNSELEAIAVSGDGDTASIGIGQFIHLLRRNVPLVYIVENNGVYGLTKGQFSATADRGQVLKKIGENPFCPIDVCMEALVANCGFVARSFAGDPKQVKELLKAALSFNGTAVLDIISPCVTFNNRDESSKSYAWGLEHEDPVHDVTYVPRREEIQVELDPGEVTAVEMHDGSRLMLKKLGRDYDPTDRIAAITLLEEARCRATLLTGLIYFNEDQEPLHDIENLTATPLSQLSEAQMRPDRDSLNQILTQFQ